MYETKVAVREVLPFYLGLWCYRSSQPELAMGGLFLENSQVLAQFYCVYICTEVVQISVWNMIHP